MHPLSNTHVIMYFFNFFTLALVLLLNSSSGSSTDITSPESPDVPYFIIDTYVSILIRLKLLRPFIQQSLKNAGFPKERNNLLKALNTLNTMLQNDEVIEIMTGYKGRVYSEAPYRRLLRIFRRDTRNPFADEIDFSRMHPIPDGINIESFEDEALISKLLDENKIRFTIPDGKNPLAGFNLSIKNRTFFYLYDKVSEIFFAQSCAPKSPFFDLSSWIIFADSQIVKFSFSNFRMLYEKLNEIVFVKA